MTTPEYRSAGAAPSGSGFNEGIRANASGLFLFTLAVADRPESALFKGWLLLGLGALLLGGVFSVLIVLSRTPFFQDIIPWVDFFHTALVVHVDLTVLVWFLAFAGLLWCHGAGRRLHGSGVFAVLLATCGAAVIALSPFTGNGNPLMSNYVPVLRNPVFFTGMVLFAAGFAIQVVRALATPWHFSGGISGEDTLRFGLFVAAVASFLSGYALLMSWLGLGNAMQGLAWFDRLFWGSGHVMQICHTQLMLIAWLWLASISGAPLRLSPRVVFVLFFLGMSPLFMVPVIYLSLEVTSGAHLFWFTQLMKYGGVLGALPIGLAVVWALAEHRSALSGKQAERNALVVSVLLFGAGGIIGFLIRGSDVTVPAHYHGSIVGITVAFMGVTYHLLPALGYRRVTTRLAQWQPWLYGGGQLMHILGLAWSGGYGVQRKVAGAAQGLDRIEQVAGMALMGIGGLISIIGGFLFLLIAWISIRPMVRSSP